MPNSPITNAMDQPVAYSEEVHAGGLSFADYVQIISGAKEIPSSEVDALMIAAEIMMADSLEEGLGERQAEGLEKHIGEQFVINDFRLNKGDEKFNTDGKSRVYAAIDATFTTGRSQGERVVLTTGSLGVLGGLGLVLKLNTWGQTFTTKSVGVDKGNAFKLIYVPPVEDKTGSVKASGEDAAF